MAAENARQAAGRVLRSSRWRQSHEFGEDENGEPDCDYSRCTNCDHVSSDQDGYLTYEIGDEIFDICPICVSTGRWSIEDLENTENLIEPLRNYVDAANQWHVD